MEEAWTAYCSGSLPIGAVVVGVDGQVLSRGRNRIFESAGEGRHLYGHRLAHAEMNALVNLDHAGTDPSACALYTTTEPCPLCIGATRMYRIGALRYAARDPLAGSVAVLEATPFLRRHPVKVMGPPNADIELALMAMHIECVLHFGNEGSAVVVGAYEESFPQAAQLGKELFQTGLLSQMRVPGLHVSAVHAALGGKSETKSSAGT